MSITIILPQAITPAAAASERAIYLYYTHTKETARIVFKRNGQYVQSGLRELNVFLRDWRRNEPAVMDPRLFDLVWEVYQEVGATQPINVVSAYRSPATNAMLAQTSSGVADNSQHMRGTAMDFYIPGVPLAKLRAVAMRKQFGGVGYYPTSGSPFVHLDVGSVRAWPRMTRAQLKEIFPDGRTMHLPNDGKPLSQEGYNVALAGWETCHRYPCDGSSSGTQVADGGRRPYADGHVLRWRRQRCASHCCSDRKGRRSSARSGRLPRATASNAAVCAIARPPPRRTRWHPGRCCGRRCSRGTSRTVLHDRQCPTRSIRIVHRLDRTNAGDEIAGASTGNGWRYPRRRRHHRYCCAGRAPCRSLASS